MADDFAANGFDTFIPDYLNGDPVPADDPTVRFYRVVLFGTMLTQIP